MKKTCLKNVLAFALFLYLFFPINGLSQQEKLEKDFIYSSEIEEIIKKSDFFNKVVSDTGNVDNKAAVKAGWDSFNEVFGLEGIGLGYIDEIFSPASVTKINGYLSEIGLGLALTQLSIDLYNGEVSKGFLNFSKSASFYAIGKRIVNKKFPKKNEVEIDKMQHIIRFTYKTRGAFAPTLLGESGPSQRGSYSGQIRTKDQNKIDVGTFSLILNIK